MIEDANSYRNSNRRSPVMTSFEEKVLVKQILANLDNGIIMDEKSIRRMAK